MKEIKKKVEGKEKYVMKQGGEQEKVWIMQSGCQQCSKLPAPHRREALPWRQEPDSSDTIATSFDALHLFAHSLFPAQPRGFAKSSFHSQSLLPTMLPGPTTSSSLLHSLLLLSGVLWPRLRISRVRWSWLVGRAGAVQFDVDMHQSWIEPLPRSLRAPGPAPRRAPAAAPRRGLRETTMQQQQQQPSLPRPPLHPHPHLCYHSHPCSHPQSQPLPLPHPQHPLAVVRQNHLEELLGPHPRLQARFQSPPLCASPTSSCSCSFSSSWSAPQPPHSHHELQPLQAPVLVPVLRPVPQSRRCGWAVRCARCPPPLPAAPPQAPPHCQPAPPAPLHYQDRQHQNHAHLHRLSPAAACHSHTAPRNHPASTETQTLLPTAQRCRHQRAQAFSKIALGKKIVQRPRARHFGPFSSAC
eukprot:m.135365 g.135365  ORF g.135365 m.135365 type:complete len:412 (-) comp14868_c3_seq1:1612-2847(-)